MVQSKRRLVHILHLTGLIERRKDQPQTINLIGPNPAAIVLFKQSPRDGSVASPFPALCRNLPFAGQNSGPPLPLPRVAASMETGDHKQGVVFDDEKQRVGKTAQEGARRTFLNTTGNRRGFTPMRLAKTSTA
jgi:hypothetical protein